MCDVGAAVDTAFAVLVEVDSGAGERRLAAEVVGAIAYWGQACGEVEPYLWIKRKTQLKRMSK